MKLRINEDVEFTSDIPDIEDIIFKPDADAFGNVMNSPEVCPDCGCETCVCEQEFNMYECLEALAFVFLLASNDIHTIHVNACGDNFKELHLEADALYRILGEYSDTCFEMCCEDGHFINSLNDAKELVDWTCYDCGCKSFNNQTGTQAIIDILHEVTIAISELYPDVPSDIQSTMDEWTRELNSKMNYFLGRVVEVNHIFSQTNEGIMSQYITRNRRRTELACEHLDKLKLGQSYTLFSQVEDHIDDYNVNPIDLKEGDYIIRDFQFGHLPNGGNKGYIPYKVNAVVYDDVSDKNGYYDRRTRLELTDDIDDPLYVVCQNDRFNGMFHKLKKSSMQK